MGDFSHQCCISNQVIKNTYLIPIVVKKQSEPVELKSSRSSSFFERSLESSIYSQEPFTPLGFMFAGKYNSYGTYDIDWQTNSEMFLSFIKYLQENSYITFQGENTLYESSFNPKQEYFLEELIELQSDGYSFQTYFNELQQKINNGRVFLKTHLKNTGFELKFAIIEKIAGDELESNFFDQTSFICNTQNIYSLLKDHYNDYFKESEKIISLYKSKGLCSLEEDFDKLSLQTNIKPFKYFLTHLESVYVNNILEYTIEKDKVFKYETVQLLLKLNNIVQGLNLLNIGLKPVLYDPNGFNNKKGELFSNIIANITAKYKKQY